MIGPGTGVRVDLACGVTDTGEEITQTDSIDGFIQKAAWITSPEKAFEASQARLSARQDALLKAEDERRKSATKLVEDNYTQTIGLARDMFAKSQAQAKEAREAAVLTGEADSAAPAMTWVEAFREAQRIMVDGPSARQQEAEAGALPPVARRPQ